MPNISQNDPSAVTQLLANRLRPVAWSGFDPGQAPQSEDQAYRMQDDLHLAMTDAGLGQRTGWKIGCTTPVMQQVLDINHPCSGGVFESFVRYEDWRFTYGDFHHVGVECEIAVRLGGDLPVGGAPYSKEEVAERVIACMAAMELVDDRYADIRALGGPSLIADDFCNAGCVLGEEVTDWRKLDLTAVEGRTLVNEKERGVGFGRDVLGHPLEALAWLANTKAARGQALAKGEFILLGSLVEVQWLEPGDRVEMQMSGLGAVSAEFPA